MLRLEGFDELSRQLDNLSNRLEELDGEHAVPLPELMSDDFIRRFTDFQTLQEMVDAGNIESEDDLGTDAWNHLVKERTRFADWQEMLSTAGSEWASRKLRV